MPDGVVTGVIGKKPGLELITVPASVGDSHCGGDAGAAQEIAAGQGEDAHAASSPLPAATSRMALEKESAAWTMIGPATPWRVGSRRRDIHLRRGRS